MGEQEHSLDEVNSPRGAQKHLRSHPRHSAQQPQRSPLGVLLWFAAGAFFSLFAYTEIRKSYFGQPYKANITDKYKVTRGGGRRGSPRTYHYVEYVYEVEGWRRGDHDYIDYETWLAARPGETVNVYVTKVFGTYFANYFKNVHEPSIGLMWLWTTASAGCFSLSLFYLCHNFASPLPGVDWGEQMSLHVDRAKEIGAISPELAGPLPRRVGFKRPAEHTRGYAFLALVPFLLAGADLVVLVVLLARDKDQGTVDRAIGWIAMIIVSIVALAWNVVWGWVVYASCAVLIERWIKKRLYRWGTVVEGCIVRKWQKKRQKESADLHLECEFDHPGFGLRKIQLRVKRREYRKTDEGRRVSVLCYPHRRWPTQVYEYGGIFRCY